jgi:pyruvate formate lyase activating enzyme
MTGIAATPAATLTRARAIAHRAGLRFVYTGNVHDVEGGTTRCPGCGEALIVRDWHEVRRCAVGPEGACAHCATVLPGRFAAFERGFGRRRIPVRIAPGQGVA